MRAVLLAEMVRAGAARAARAERAEMVRAGAAGSAVLAARAVLELLADSAGLAECAAEQVG